MNARNLRRVGLAALLTGLFVVVEIVGGLISGSLALLADAGHMLTDFAALAMAWAGFRLAQRPPTARLPFGYQRLPVLVAFVNGLTLFAVAGWIVWEAVHRLAEPGAVMAGPMLAVALAGLVVNLVVFAILMGADRGNLNIRGALLHVIGDLLGSVAAIAAAVIIYFTGFIAADPLLSVLVALLILRSAWGLVRESAHVLLQGAPEDFDAHTVVRDLLDIDGVADAGVRAWSLTQERLYVTVVATAERGASPDGVREAIRAQLLDRFPESDVTIELRQA